MLIRKVAIGSDYKNAMNYVVGQVVLGGSHFISSITELGDGAVCIWIYNNQEKETVMWKKVNRNTPISFEYNIEF